MDTVDAILLWKQKDRFIYWSVLTAIIHHLTILPIFSIVHPVH